MYSFLCKYLPKPLANGLITVVYLLMILFILYALETPGAEFRYFGL